MHMKKFFSAGLCLMLLVYSLAPMAACENNVSVLPRDDQTKIEELQKQLEERQQRIDTLEQENEAPPHKISLSAALHSITVTEDAFRFIWTMMTIVP